MRFILFAVVLGLVCTAVITSECSAREQVRPLELPAEVAIPPEVDLAGSFTFRMCVRMNAAPGDLPTLATNKAWGDGEIRDYTTNNAFGLGRESGKARGFAISVLPDGAWTWNAGDGKYRIDHRPEARDQGIADGHWHEVGFAIDRARGVASLFHDGRRVALHDLQGVGPLRGEMTALRVGFADAGLEIGDVRLDPGAVDRARVTGDFVARFGAARRPAPLPEWDGPSLRVLAWNIWHGGRRKGRDEGVKRVVEVIEESGADIVLMQETYGSGPRISGRLGFDYFLRSSNLSVMSRFPIVDVHRLGPGFRFGGVTIELRPGVRVQAYSLWINYLPSVQKQLAEGATAKELAAADAETRGREIDAILEELLPHLAKTPEMPVIVGGDFNSGSHLDWTNAAAGLSNHLANNEGRVVAWPVSRSMERAGFIDTFRVAHPDPVKAPGRTWSPEFRDSHQDRIDYVYLRGDGWRVEDAEILDEHPREWPSDHAASLAIVRLGPVAPGVPPTPGRRTSGPASTAPARGSGPIARFEFDGNTDNAAGPSVTATADGVPSFVDGLDGQALGLRPSGPARLLTLDGDRLPFGASDDFSVQYWIRTTAGPERRMVVLAQKKFVDNSLASQKQPGWVSYISGGTWAWSMGSGARRITYERDNGHRMPVNDGAWHLLSMSYDSALSQVRLYYDGDHKAVYHVRDSRGFDFTSKAPLVVGWAGTEASPRADIVPPIRGGARNLQALVDAFNRQGVGAVEPDEFVHLIVDPERLRDRKAGAMAGRTGTDATPLLKAIPLADRERVYELEGALMGNPYTIHQALSFMEAAPLLKIYALVDGKVVIDERAARAFTERERLYPAEYDIDRLEIWDRALTPEEVRESHAEFSEPGPGDLEEEAREEEEEGEALTITAACWNIFHGGRHFTTDEHGWDSRLAIAEILEREGVDVVMMQETYSSGDYIAAELGFRLATTVDWDYLNQGSNISVLSRFPIKDLYVPEKSSFVNVGVRVVLDDTQDLFVMSNWYGMRQFADVFDFHRERFAQSDRIPTLFAGDFNAVPHQDGGDSPASRAMLDDGFIDAFRSLCPDAVDHPGHTHRSGSRIDQLYYKGRRLRNTSTRIISTASGEFPSDHYLILSTFELDRAPADTGSR